MPPLPLRSRTLLVSAIATPIGAGALWLRFEQHRDHIGITPGVLPACDSPATRNFLRGTIAGSPAAQAAGLRVIKLGYLRHHRDGVRDTTQMPARVCEGEVFANTGRRTLGFSLEWTGADRQEVWLSVP